MEEHALWFLFTAFGFSIIGMIIGYIAGAGESR